LKLSQERSEQDIVRTTQLINQYIVLEDTLIAGVEKFEGMILRPKDKLKLDNFVAELEQLTRSYQEDWSDEFWSIYKFHRGIFSEILPMGVSRNRLANKLAAFRSGGPIQLSLFEETSEIEHNDLEIEAPANSTMSAVSDRGSAPPNSTVSALEHNSTVSARKPASSTPPPMTTLKGQDQMVPPPRSVKVEGDRHDEQACCAKCSVM
jgi:hypothetical protein